MTIYGRICFKERVVQTGAEFILAEKITYETRNNTLEKKPLLPIPFHE
jgi:hypothetical protein